MTFYPVKTAFFAILVVILTQNTLYAQNRIVIHPLKASWYSTDSLKKEGTWSYSNGIMANGQRFNDKALTCACRLYPLGTKLKITNLKNGQSVIVTVTDRIGKRFANSRIDLSQGAFSRIANLKEGLIIIRVEMV